MTGNEYQAAALKTAGRTYETKDGLQVAILALCGEAGETANEMKKVIEGKKPLDPLTFSLELGDVLWYIAIASHLLGVPLEDVMESNVNKLEARYAIAAINNKRDEHLKHSSS